MSSLLDLSGEGADDALDHLVNQFADPLAFLRELVQNALDAGSTEVDVACELRGGAMIIRVDDYGEGMDRAIIDTRLTRLFTSDKEGDRTKIGKFGIGFVSVFAIQPDAVCIDTGRTGESWRVIFHRDRTFTRIRLSEAVEGTKIQVIKAVTAQEHAVYRRRVREVLHYFCKHVDATLRFEGEIVTEPFDLGLPLKVALRDPLATVVVGHTEPGQADLAGFYNRGLTLIERQGDLPRISFKINSPYLAHTLSRDNIIQDESYNRALDMVRRLAAGPLCERVLVRLGEALRDGEPMEVLRPLQDLLAWHLQRGSPPGVELAARPVGRSPSGEIYTFGACQQAAASGRLYVAAEVSPLGTALVAAGMVVLDAAQAELAYAFSSEPRFAGWHFALPLPLSGEAPAGAAALKEATLLLLQDHGAAAAGVELGRFVYPGSGVIAAMPALAQSQPFSLSPLADVQRLGRGMLVALSGGRTLVLNLDHQAVPSLCAVAQHEPEFAAYTMAKLFFLGHQLGAELDAALLQAAMKRRCRRRHP